MDVVGALKLLRERLTKASVGGGEVGAFANELLPLTIAIEAALDGASASTHMKASAEYLIEMTPSGEVVAEHRVSGKANPLRCSRSVYDKVITILAEAKVPMTTAEIIEAVRNISEGVTGDYQVRVAMRMLMQASPPLLIRHRARYRLVDVSTFAANASALWASLRK